MCILWHQDIEKYKSLFPHVSSATQLLSATGVTVAATTTPSAFAGGHKERQDKYMKGEQDGYKKGKHANGKYNGGDNGNTVTIQANKQNGKVSGHDNTLEQEAQNVICTHPSSTCVSEGSETNATDTTDNNPGGA
jgi:hypothetical protein